jgi:hypothetical protein
MIIQIYEIQEPKEAALMAECGVDHIGGVILSPNEWMIPVLKDSVSVIRESGRKSSIIPLFADPEAVYRVIDWYQPTIVHFCDSLNHEAAVDESSPATPSRAYYSMMLKEITEGKPDPGRSLPTRSSTNTSRASNTTLGL